MLNIAKNCYDSKTKDPFQALKGLKVLIVDDNLDSLDLISVILEIYGAEVLAAESALKALEVIDKFQPEILVSDIALPNMDGYSLIRTIRQNQCLNKNILAIAVTALNREEVFDLAAQAGFQACLIKPFETDDFIELLVSLHSEQKNRVAVSKVLAA